MLQKREIRTMCKDHFPSHCKPLFQNLKILTLTSLFILEVAAMVIKNPAMFKNNSVVHSYNTRSTKRYTSTELTRKGAQFCSIKLYNKIAQEKNKPNSKFLEEI